MVKDNDLKKGERVIQPLQQKKYTQNPYPHGKVDQEVKKIPS